MTKLDSLTPRAATGSRRLLLAGTLIAILVTVVLALLVASRDDDLAATSTSIALPSEETNSPSATTTPSVRSTVIARLREILQIREQAFRERNATLFDHVYTDTCSCLRAGRDAIAALRRENVVWTNRSISVEIQSAESVGDNLWEVVALFVSDSFDIETEEGKLVREAPAERLRYRFLLARTSSAETWKLERASLIEG
jgi:hypothetical protein